LGDHASPRAAADFASQPAAAAQLRGASTRDAFNRVLSSAVERYATSERGQHAVVTATAHLDGDHPSTAERVAEYTRLVARDPALGNALSGAALAGLLHNQAPDVTPILSGRTPVRS
nr:hypothetical protein [Candidatus Dormibacteraeota bacterium]